jgi:hypothetical protein
LNAEVISEKREDSPGHRHQVPVRSEVPDGVHRFYSRTFEAFDGVLEDFGDQAHVFEAAEHPVEPEINIIVALGFEKESEKFEQIYCFFGSFRV